jgi:hypothetical protein
VTGEGILQQLEIESSVDPIGQALKRLVELR